MVHDWVDFRQKTLQDEPSPKSNKAIYYQIEKDLQENNLGLESIPSSKPKYPSRCSHSALAEVTRNNTTHMRWHSTWSAHTTECFPSRASHIQGQKYLMSSEEEAGSPMGNAQSKRNSGNTGISVTPQTGRQSIQAGGHVHMQTLIPFVPSATTNMPSNVGCWYLNNAQQSTKGYGGKVPPRGNRRCITVCHLTVP